MADVKLQNAEAQVLRQVLQRLVVRNRTGELGIVHGADRFVSTQLCLKKSERQALDDAAKKLGLANGVGVRSD